MNSFYHIALPPPQHHHEHMLLGELPLHHHSHHYPVSITITTIIVIITIITIMSLPVHQITGDKARAAPRKSESDLQKEMQ